MALQWQLADQCLTLEGSFTLAAIHQQPKIQTWFKAKQYPFNRIDLTGIDQLDSAGLACLVCWLEGSSDLKLIGLPSTAKELAQLYNLQQPLNQACA
ncbi:lipid asymmetry maintenance protein MlaB [Thiomicrospira sp. ALE5]|uniref:STAS domain-containing protein n=1 Tax=Thiomicrospira sp. ALE5 TaxID=748650 RepID=UPI0008EEE64D|nr:hypothetical protein [Thiomicrospira sp. ALE5]SFR59778.1 phospholipid transport system transporter-binding protein [Thiomicrospira sp. ALE5]